MAQNPSLDPRPFCYKCWRPELVCLCSHVRTFDSPIRLGILQHPDENKMPINTARLLSLCMPNSSFLVQGCFDICQDPIFKSATADTPRHKIAVLYPHPNAKPIEELQGKIDTLLLLDGTWREAQKIWHHNQSQFIDYQLTAFTPSEPSRYRIRKEPSDLHVSSLEAAVIALRALSGDSKLGQEALDLFEIMVEKQLSFRGKNSRHRDNKERCISLGIRDRNRIRNKLFNTSVVQRLEWLSKLDNEELNLIQDFARTHGVHNVFSADHLGIQSFQHKLSGSF